MTTRLAAVVVALSMALSVVGCGSTTIPTPSPAKALTAFEFRPSENPSLATAVIATFNGDAIAATVPAGTDVTALVASFESTGTSVTVDQTPQLSGTTPNDFVTPVVFRVTAADDSYRDYTVTVTVASSVAKEITSFAFLAVANSALAGDITATIAGDSITATVPFGTNPSALVATFSTTGTSVTVGGNVQNSGATANDFTSAVTYRVTAADASTRDYTVTVTVASSAAKSIIAYSFRSATNAGLAANVTATINGNLIAATLPFGTNVTALVATFTITGATITVAGTAQISGTTANNFGSPVMYRVTAADGSTRDYNVSVTVAANSAKDLTAYAFLSANNAGLRADVTATITTTTIRATVPFGTDVTALVATFSMTGNTIVIGTTAQISGITANDFTAPIVYRVTAADGSTRDFTVIVTVARDPATVPRLIAPLSTARVTSRRPQLRWVLPGPGTMARVEICSDPACATVIEAIDVTGTSVQPSADLPAGFVYWRVQGLATDSTLVTTPTWQFRVPKLGAAVDTSWSTSFDVNLDGYVDVAVGATDIYNDGGIVRVYLGSATGLVTPAAATLVGPDGDGFGSPLASAGDVNGDGYPELIVGAIESAPRAYVYAGTASGISSSPAATLPYGWSLTAVSDVNHDGYGDVAVGAPADNAVQIFFGSAAGLAATPSLTLDAPSGASTFGLALDAGDFDGDGFGDLAVGGDERVDIFAGSAAGLTVTSLVTLDPPPSPSQNDQPRFGFALATPDVNADGCADLVVSAPLGDFEGTVSVFPGGSAGLSNSTASHLPWGHGGEIGTSLAGADVDGDGYDEVIAGQPGKYNASFYSHDGGIVVFRGGATGVRFDTGVVVNGPMFVASWFGMSVSAADIDRDGDADVLIGAPRLDGTTTSDDGAVFLVRGKTLPDTAFSVWTEDSSILGPANARSWFGRAIR